MITTTDSLPSAGTSVIFAGDYLNKISGEKIEHEARRRLEDGHSEIIVNFSQTELVNSIGISILLGLIDIASSKGAKIVFTDMNDHTIELFDMLGLTRHVEIH